MDIVKEIFGLIKDVAWPLTILVIALLFRNPITNILFALLPSDYKRQRNLKFKVGQFELESQVVAKVQERAEAIAREPDLSKRLVMAKEPFLVEEALKLIDAKQLEILEKLYNNRIENACLINWYRPIDGVDPSICTVLEKLGLIVSTAMYDGDEVARITPVGMALLERVGRIGHAQGMDTPK
ncbi:hypothetical protein QPK87_17070 [Kamptonema cortianum]|uniref:Uncharacterized protein n=1 Tax=Geitlerinema calcuttense NRMC-F 0142 TaxID=2922238 RepID=A0ABT7LWX8_9CYAN|nr:hypothetical protein [Geitlerinema calcuttense]MDK3158266.1 hypothetical protein [Kamptonema cortianum]MDL5056526.1 hypothetical protein [Geitlerinema calcuttense NRMC-F 0142]